MVGMICCITKGRRTGVRLCFVVNVREIVRGRDVGSESRGKIKMEIVENV